MEKLKDYWTGTILCILFFLGMLVVTPVLLLEHLFTSKYHKCSESFSGEHLLRTIMCKGSNYVDRCDICHLTWLRKERQPLPPKIKYFRRTKAKNDIDSYIESLDRLKKW